MLVVDFKRIEQKWQKRWDKAKIFQPKVNKKRKKFFLTFPYPYVNGAPHIGHMFSAYRVDSYARFKRMQGFNVLFPQAFHATGEPILGAIKRIREGDEIQINTLKFFGASDEDIKNFVEKGPEYFAYYWMNKWKECLKKAGFSIDWRRSFLTIDPTYQKFVEWQYKKLKELGYVIQGTHPVIWCPNCQSPTGDHDRLKGEGESPMEFIILKFKLNEKIIPCGTLRPETIFGVTNIWINPGVEYVIAKIDSEEWILSEEAARKLKDQLKKVEVIGKIKGRELIGKWVENPVLGNRVIILPANFVDPEFATGIVMSVPSHAPYDYIALKELKENPEKIEEFGIQKEILDQIQPISIIRTEGFGEHPAIEICEKLGIKSQTETEKLDKATEEIYKKEFHLGILKENCKEFSGKRVSEVKEKLIEKFKTQGIADTMWEPSGEVVCRCKTKCHVKILENQWFFKYSDEKWKEKVLNWIPKMKIYPEAIRDQFINTVKWLKDKACARKSGLGTKLPWDKEWIVEPLSDSTIYMSYYTISRIINEKKIEAERLIPEVFDYVFLGKGKIKEVSRKSGIDEKILKEMKEEFEYFYPVDFRGSGKDLVQNHLTFFIFHHVAIWNKKKYWPKAIGVNGYVQVRGEKMSKSKGNIIPMLTLLEKIGTDLTRINLISSNEDLDDADWREENLQAFSSRINFLFDTIRKIKRARRRKLLLIDKFVMSKLQRIIEATTNFYEQTKFRSVTQTAFFESFNLLKWYLERCESIRRCNQKILRKFIENLVLILTPLLPHLCEEMWEKLGKKRFVSIERWPKVNKKLINEDIEISEAICERTIEDIREIIKILKKKPQKISIFIAHRWKFKLYEVMKRKKINIEKAFEIAKRKDEEIAKYFKKLEERIGKIEKIPKREILIEFFNEIKKFLSKEFGCKIEIVEAEKSDNPKARQADIDKPGIFIE